jgi:hypothetical protein
VKKDFLSQIHLASVTEQPAEAIAPKAQVIFHKQSISESASPDFGSRKYPRKMSSNPAKRELSYALSKRTSNC